MPTGKITRSAQLFAQSWAVLRTHPSLVAFPILSGIATLAVVAFFAAPVLLSETLQADFERLLDAGKSENPDGASISPAIGLLLLGAFILCNFVTIFFNAALLGAADRALRGEPTGIGAGIAAAASKIHLILGWCLVNSLLGLLLSLLERRVPLAGRIAIRLVGAAWGIACFFVVPVLVVEGLGPIAAVRRSVEVLRKGWGEGLALAIGFSAISMVLGVVVAFLFVTAAVAGALTRSAALGLGIGSIAVAIVIGWMVVASALKTVAQLALFRYASTGSAPQGFDQNALQSAFVNR